SLTVQPERHCSATVAPAGTFVTRKLRKRTPVASRRAVTWISARMRGTAAARASRRPTEALSVDARPSASAALSSSSAKRLTRRIVALLPRAADIRERERRGQVRPAAEQDEHEQDEDEREHEDEIRRDVDVRDLG